MKNAEDDICGSSVYSDNRHNNRDEIIQDCIRDIDTAYKMLYAEEHQLNWQNVDLKDTIRDHLLPLKALLRVDRILYDNISHYCSRPEDYLLYHNYMLTRRNSEKCIGVYKKWFKTHKSEDTVIDFQETYLQFRTEQNRLEKYSAHKEQPVSA